jgi:hypothetical protein
MGLLPFAMVPRQMESNDQLLIYWIPYEGILGGSAVVDETECQRQPSGITQGHAARAHETCRPWRKDSLETSDADHDPRSGEFLPQSMIMFHKSTKLDLRHGGLVGSSSS